MRMRKSVALLIVLVFLTASCLIVAKPAFSSASEAENTWATKAPMHQARAGLGVAAVNGKIYAIGGNTQSGVYPALVNGEFVGTNEEYDIATDTWTTKTPMPTPRAFFAIAVYQNKIYCIGGIIGIGQGFYDGTSILLPTHILSGVNEVYDPATDTWENKTAAPVAGMMMKAAVLNGKIYLIDGNLNEVYDPNSDTWTTKTPPPISFEDFGPAGGNDYDLVVFDNKLHVAGVFSQQLITYNEETDSWSQEITMPAGDYYYIAVGMTTGVMAPKRLYFLFAVRGSSTAVNQAYDVRSDLWVAGKSLPNNRCDFGVAVVNDKLYAIGGCASIPYPIGYFVPSAVNEQYTPMGYGTVPPIVDVVLPEKQTYNSTNVSLVFTVNKPVNWTGYSLDGQDNVTVTGNTTLSGISNGLHNVTVYARDEFENTGASETISFSVDVPFPVVPVAAASVAVVAVVIAGLLVYFKKRRREAEPT
jgi:hypothetical protein